MYAYYTLKNGRRICAFLWSDILKGYDYREKTSLYPINKNGKILFNNSKEIDIRKDKNGKLYFIVNNEIIYFNDFDYLNVNELINKLEEEPDKVTPDDVAATFMKDANNVGLLAVLPEIDFFMPEVAISIFSCENKEKVLCILSEREYFKELWNYKITLEAEAEENKLIYGTQVLYTSDLTSALKSGTINLVNINEYKNKNKMVKVLK